MLYRIIPSLLLLLATVSTQAQFHPQTPKGKPGVVSLPSPKNLQIPKPDAEIVSVAVIGTVERAASHEFVTTIRVTYRNNGPGDMPRNASLKLYSFYDTRSGGTDYVQIGATCNVHRMSAGESRTDEWVFVKDITQMGRERLQCFMKLDAENLVSEANEENNRSANFYITPPRS